MLAQETLGLDTGMLFAVPIPADKAADSSVIKKGIEQALREADEQKIGGALITPFMLKRVNELTGGESAASNVALIKNNAVIGARISVALSQMKKQQKPQPQQKSSSGPARITIVGGAAVDIISQAAVGEGLNSQMGKITMAPGGSTRNAAECLARLGLHNETMFISGIGTDSKNAIIRNSLSEVGLSLAGLYVNPNHLTAAYNAMLSENGDMFCGVSDMEVLEFIDEAHLMSFNFPKSEIVLIDSNVGLKTLGFVINNVQNVKHVIYEPIS